MRQSQRARARSDASGYTRREFLGQTAAVGLSLAMMNDARAQAPKRGGHLIVGVHGANSGDSLDPARYTGSYMALVGQQFYDTLTAVDEQLAVQPALAETWSPKVGAREWTIRLRRGVTFHNGKEMTATDVAYSLNYHRRPESKSAAAALLTPVSDIKVTAKHELTVMLDKGNADLPYLLADYHLCIGPDGGTFTDGVGTGPFVLDSFQPGVRTLTKRHPNFWRTDRGFVDSVETLAINDGVARMSALQSGAIHLMTQVDPRAAAQIEKDPQIQIFNVSGPAHYAMSMRCDGPPYDNKDLRLALKYAIDREAMLKTVLRGYGKLGNDHPIPVHDRFFAADIPQRPYDPERAKFHYRRSGHSGPVVLTAAPTFSGALDIAQLFQATALKAEITLQVDRTPADGYWTNVWMKRPFVLTSWSGRPTADLMFATAYTSDAPWNETFWKRPEFDKLLIAARAELDTPKRKQMYRELQFMVHDDGGEIIPMFPNYLEAGSRKLRGFVPSPSLWMSGLRAPEKVWFES